MTLEQVARNHPVVVPQETFKKIEEELAEF